ncbi:hypothetical protein ATANTOWER_018797 [Ataeniobius toweri]|uniref:Uncharacterized protein n=1 Tax=Ataeniobius toweri TaxID=208326 RepID=A0ABU7AQW3_9TELE|nr:hypothetical protein [Ataeniobius toweri]
MQSDCVWLASVLKFTTWRPPQQSRDILTPYPAYFNVFVFCSVEILSISPPLAGDCEQQTTYPAQQLPYGARQQTWNVTGSGLFRRIPVILRPERIYSPSRMFWIWKTSKESNPGGNLSRCQLTTNHQTDSL